MTERPTSASEKTLLDRLAAEFPPDFSTTDAAELREYGKDWTKTYAPDPVAIAFPRTTDEVSRVLKLCHELDYPVVPSGGRTGLAGGAVAPKRELVLSLSRMRDIGPIDVAARTVRVQAGAITEAVHERAKAEGLTWPVDFASKGSSCVGGNIATNAGGVNVIRYGLTRNWVLGLQVALADGRVLELNGALEKNNTGLDLRQLFIGSEGTLGVITEATLKLSPPPGPSDVFLFAARDLDVVLDVFGVCRRAGFTLNAFEFFTDRCLARVTKHLKLRAPFGGGASAAAAGAPSAARAPSAEALPAGENRHYVLVDLERPADPSVVEGWLEGVLAADGVLDGTMAQTSADARALWMLREGISESLSSTGLPHKNDISLPIAGLKGFCSEFESFIAGHYPHWEICNFGHIGDGNLHVNVMKPESMGVDEFRATTKAVDREMFALVRKYDGSISAEHGIGLLKKEFLPYSRTAREIELFREMKRALDPKGILNPGKIFDATIGEAK